MAAGGLQGPDMFPGLRHHIFNADGTPSQDMPFWGHGSWEEPGPDQSPSAHSICTPAMNAFTAAAHAEVAAKHAASLAQWVQYLWGTLATLQNKVQELEDWKRRALEDVRKLREEHRALKKKVFEDGLGDDTPASVQLSKLKSLSPSITGDAPQAIFPPGFGEARLADSHSPPGSPSCTKASDWDEAADLPHKNSSLCSISSEFSGYLTEPDTHHEGVLVSIGEVDGFECERAEWRIGQLSTKLRGCMGRALVSSPFSAAGLQDIRFMVCADGKDTTKGPRSRRQKEIYTKKVMEGPLDGCLKLKVSSSPPTLELQYYLKVGTQRRGPFRHNFSENTVCGCDDFGIDWLKQLEADSSLTVTVEILKEPHALPS